MSYYNKGGRGGGGYRGGGGGYRGSRGSSEGYRGGRGSFNSSRGGSGGGFGSGRYFSNNSESFDSRPPRSTFRGGGADRFSGKSREEYHGSTSYRDDFGQDRRLSPEPPRKRGRPDDSSFMGSRRSNERSFSSNEYSRGFDKGPGGGYLTEKGSYREVRETKPDYAFRKPASKFAPRGRGGIRGRGTPRASFRGTVRGRGFKSTTSYLARRRMESLGVRKRAGSDFRRGNPYRRRFGAGIGDRLKKSDDEEEDEEELGDEEAMDEEMPEGEEGMEDEEEVEDEHEGEDEEEEEVEDGDIDGEADEDKDISLKEEKDSAGEEKKEGDDGKGEKKDAVAKKKMVAKKKKVIPTKKVVKKEATADKDKAEENDDDAKEEEGDVEGDPKEDDDGEGKRKDFRGQPFIRLHCPHCNYACVTFREYSHHLTTKKHLVAMRNLSTKLRSKLTLMRSGQRRKQRALDEEAKANNLRLKTFFCQICKLNYKTLKSDHFASIEHKKIKEFLIPFCRICKLSFKSPWAYENHVSELLHIKRKAKAGEKLKKEKDIDLDPSSFMVLDAVGSGDEDESEQSGAEEAKEGEAAKDGESSPEKKPKKKKEEIKLGAEYCKLIEVFFCELCKIYLPRNEDREKGLAHHCRSRTHLQRYVRHRDDESLRRRAVKLHKELEKEKEAAMKKKSQETKKDGDDGDKKEADKEWSDVDKDISELLNDGDDAQEDDGAGEEEHGEDDDSRQEDERYDRFKKSDKADKEGGKAATAPNGSLSAEDTPAKPEVKEDK